MLLPRYCVSGGIYRDENGNIERQREEQAARCKFQGIQAGTKGGWESSTEAGSGSLITSEFYPGKFFKKIFGNWIIVFGRE